MSKKEVFIVGLCGGTASGKTLVVNRIMETYNKGEVSVLSMDNYYRSINDQKKDENGYINFDLPQAIDIEKLVNDINALLAGKTLEIEEYNFNNPAIKPKKIEVKPAKILILEGIFVLGVKEISEIANMKVFLDVDEKDQLERKIERDMKERGMDMEWIMYQWEYHTKPGYNKYIAPYIKDADVVVDKGTGTNATVNMLSMMFDEILDNNEL